MAEPCTGDVPLVTSRRVSYQAIVGLHDRRSLQWETRESTYEPLDLTASDDPITCTEYALKHNMLDEAGWKRFRHYTRNTNTLGRIVNQTKVSSYGGEPFWKFGVLVPRTHKLAMEHDMENNSKKWQDAE
jgi:hypothetical protein